MVKAVPTSIASANFRKCRFLVSGDMVRSFALDFVLRLFLGSAPHVPLVVEITLVNPDDLSGDPPAL